MDSTEFDYVVDLGNKHTEKSLVSYVINVSDIIILATPTYYPSYQVTPNFPKFLSKFEKELLQIRNKYVIVVGSGRSEYKHFCGAVDYFREHYVKANYVKVIKFEGYPRQREIDSFTREMREILREGKILD